MNVGLVSTVALCSLIMNLWYVYEPKWNTKLSWTPRPVEEEVSSSVHDTTDFSSPECSQFNPGCSQYTVRYTKLSWTRRAAEEAEAAAQVSCSGHGHAYLDGFLVHGTPVCECNACFSGPDCSHFDPQCPADASFGDIFFLEPFWKQHAASSAVVVAGWHRMGYKFNDETLISSELQKHIQKLHSIVNNAVTKGKYIIFGAGTTQLLSAAVYALSPKNSSTPTAIVASIPYFYFYRLQTDFFRSVDFSFKGDASLWGNGNTTDKDVNIVEFVTSPNNPDCQFKLATLKGSSVKAIHDHAYYWPHYTPIPAPSDEEVMLFTISKLTGHAGSRFGWALVKDKEVYERMSLYMRLATMGVSRDTQLRALKLLKVILEGDGREIFGFAYKTMSKRWEALRNIISMSKRFSIQEIPSRFCTFSQEVREASPAYAWVKCEWEEDEDCGAVLQAGNIIGSRGDKFGAVSRYVRLALLGRQDEFDLLLLRLKNLISNETHSATI